MRHAFVPMTNGSPRCARCLRHLDCVPHLPVEPRQMTPAEILGSRTSTSSESRRRAELWYSALVTHQLFARAAR